MSNIQGPTSKQAIEGATGSIVSLLKQNKKALISTWVDVVRKEFNEPESTTDEQLADHMIYIIDALIDEFQRFETDSSRCKSNQQGDMDYDDGEIEDKKGGGEHHGKQRAQITAYNADKIFQEYVLLRKLVVEFLQAHHPINIDHMEIITCVIESCSRESLLTFTASVQKVQGKLLGSIIHDVRSPLNSISMMGEFIAMGEDTKQSTIFANKIVSSSQRISTMLEDMLLSLSLEAGQGLILNFRHQNLSSFLHDISRDAQSLYGIRLKVALSDGDLFAVFDETALSRAIENLISNAFKYGDHDTDVTISAYQTDKNNVIDVHNYGHSIDESRWKDIFLFLKKFDAKEESTQIRKGNRDRSYGIGLAYVKAAIEGHGGCITMSSDDNLGTRFLIELPIQSTLAGKTVTVPI